MIIFTTYVLNTIQLSQADVLPSEYTYIESTIDHKEELQKAIHDSQQYERKMYSLIQFGKYHEMTTFLNKSTYQGNDGILANEKMRHQKNAVICSCTLAARHAVEGGVSYDQAMSYADAIIQKVELATTMNTLMNLHKNMLKRFTKMVYDKKINDSTHGLSSQVRNYIELHLYESISGDDLSFALQLSRTYISTQFKLETGLNVNDFINKTKIDEAKRLFQTTNSSIADVSNQLAFSSQSYFQVIFKKYTNQTPKQFIRSAYQQKLK